jgi:hypothetical protein
MSFKEWLKLNENGTSTADVAVFARPVMTSMDRRFPQPITFGKEDPFFKKRKKGNCVACKQHLP